MKSLLFLSSQDVFSKYSFLTELVAACHLLHAGSLIGLLFGPEDGGDMFLRNVG
jgi:hypothetical protein